MSLNIFLGLPIAQKSTGNLNLNYKRLSLKNEDLTFKSLGSMKISHTQKTNTKLLDMADFTFSDMEIKRRISTIEFNHQEFDNNKHKEHFTKINEEEQQYQELREDDPLYNWLTYFNHYYMDISDNIDGNYDCYLHNSLKLLNLLPKDYNFSEEIEKRKVDLPDGEEENNNTNKKTLILDIDQTLLHADLLNEFDHSDEIITMEVDDEEDASFPIILRPGVREFLDFAVQHFELVIFTAGTKAYADAICDFLDPDNKYFKYRFYRDSCIFLDPGMYIKDLSIINNRKLENMIIVDNCLFSFLNNLSNGILVTSFYDNKNDKTFEGLMYYLEKFIVECDDVRKVNSDTFGIESYKNEVEEELNKEIMEYKSSSKYND
jgi:Dullard-like phosphatase family protein